MDAEPPDKPGCWWQLRLSTLLLLGMVCSLAITVAYYSRQAVRLERELLEARERANLERAMAQDYAARADVMARAAELESERAKSNASRIQLEMKERMLTDTQANTDERLTKEIRKLKDDITHLERLRDAYRAVAQQAIVEATELRAELNKLKPPAP